MPQLFYINWIDDDNLAHSQSFSPSANKLLVGRSPTADVIIAHPSVSRIHAELEWRENILHILDLGSTFGTSVNGTPLETNQAKALFETGEIRLGRTSLWYEIRNEEEKQEDLQTCFFTRSKQKTEDLAPDLIAFKSKIVQRLKSQIGADALLADLEDSLTQELYKFSIKQEEQLKEQRILNSISHILNRSNTVSELAKNALNLISKVLSAERGFIVLRNHETQCLDLAAKRNFSESDPQLMLVEPGSHSDQYSNTLVERCFLSGNIIIVNDTTVDDSISNVNSINSSEIKSIAVIPLVQFEKVLGVIYLDSSSKTHCFKERQNSFMETFAAHTAIALQNAQLYKRAITDDLTHLYTRKYIDERMEQELDRAKRYHRPFSILLIDLDHFKSINDTYGHSAGDLVLQTLSYLLRQRLRDTDIAGRIGGEEFIVILGETDLEGALLFAERIREEIQKEPIEKSGQTISVTASIGVACFNEKYLKQPLAMIEDADKALYQAKKVGRNRVVVAGSY